MRMKFFSKCLFVLIFSAAFAGCNSVGEVLPPNDQVLVYKLPYDLTYLRTLEALNAVPNWQLEETDKERGLVSVRNMDYSRLDDSDRRAITFAVKRVDRETTSVSIDPDSQKVFGGKKLLDLVGEALGREIRS
jgi:MFS superfamily sulfate permease-like transporter